MPLTNLKVQKAKPQAKQYKLADERGMYLLIHPKGGKYWRLDYRFEGRRKTLAIGTHPETSLKEARKKRDRARSDIEDGIDPSGHQNGNPALGDDSFETVATEWHEKYRSQWTEGHASTTLRRLEANLLPWLGKRPLGAIALLKEYKPKASVADLVTALECTGKAVTRAGVSKPRIDIHGAYRFLKTKQTGC